MLIGLVFSFGFVILEYSAKQWEYEIENKQKCRWI